MEEKMRDIQNEVDTREVPLQKVGVREVKYPVTVLDKEHKTQSTTARVDLFVNLPHNFKGTHMSRFIEVFHKYHENLTMLHFLDMHQMLHPMSYIDFLLFVTNFHNLL